jgi:glycerol-3-phosphate cytidylyltransferase
MSTNVHTNIGYVVGVFDMFHHGHVRLIDRVLSECPQLVIGIHTDDFVAEYKRRPMIHEEERKRAIVSHYGGRIKAIEIVGNSHKDIIDRHKVTHMYHGDDWEMEGYKKQIRYDEDDLGVEIVLIPYTKGVSSTQLVQKAAAMKSVSTVFFDLDNTLIVDGKATHGARDCLQFLRDHHYVVRVVTNNNRYTPAQITEQLGSVGIEFSEDEIVSSLSQIRDYLDTQGITDTYLWGSSHAADFLRGRTTDDLAEASLVVVGYNDSYTYQDLVAMVTKIGKGTPYVVGNIDPVYPSHDAVLPDTGTIAATIESTTGVSPAKIFGKPYMKLPITEDPSTYLMVGDKLTTDGELAKNNSIKFFHVTDVMTMVTLHDLLLKTTPTVSDDEYKRLYPWD